MNHLGLSEERHPDSVDLVLVDDDKLTIDIVSWNLRHSSISREFFQDPEQAMGYLSTATPRALIVDFYMPLINGVEFLEKLTDNYNIGNCMLYLCSAVAPPRQHIEKLQSIGASVLEKDQLCDKTGILKIVDQLPDVTGNSANYPPQNGSAVASPDDDQQVFLAEHTQLYKN